MKRVLITFPSSTEDGSIEASPDQRETMQSSGFRPQLRTAPLKRFSLEIRRAPPRRFPSSTEDGSIEAGVPVNCAICCNDGFRPQLRTAPLKLYCLTMVNRGHPHVSVLN